MTPNQIELARHALGLSRNKVSFRNHFVAGDTHTDFPEWEKMVASGDAKKRDGSESELSGGAHTYWMTPEGAKKALRRGERLDPEDFPLTQSKDGAGS